MDSTSKNQKVFVVDDDRGLARLIERALQREGYETASAQSGREAIAWLQENSADLLLLDLKLPDIEGAQLIQHLAQVNRSVPFIIITGQGDERVAVEMMKRGALDYLVKDVRFQEFVPTVVKRSLAQVEKEKRLASMEAALKNEHAFVAAVLDTSGALVVVLDAQGRIARFNRACERITGYTFEEVRGKPFWDLFLLPDELESVKQVFDRLTSGEFPNEHENFWLTRDGQRRLIAWSNTVLLAPDGKVEFVIATGLDITDRRRLEKEILEISDRERRRIGQDLHDGLCQQLAGIELMSQVLEQRLETKAKSEAARAAEIARHVRDSITQTRLLARGLSPVTLESEGLMAAFVELATNTEKMFQVACTVHCPELVNVPDLAVATHLFRIAQEAVSNAIKHGKARHIQIELLASQGMGTLAVRDDGSGLPKTLNKTGMGLRIMQYRAGIIGATLAIQNQPAGGTAVICSFPLITKTSAGLNAPVEKG
jgi:PAS domain S-box-containing protein